MSKKLPINHHRVRKTALRLAIAPGVALLAGCAFGGEAGDLGGEATASQSQALIGGSPAAPDYFRSTVGIGDVCTAAKVGPRLFLTAAHCVAVPRPIRGMPVPPDFPPNDGIAEDYLPGESLLIHWGLDADDPEQGEFTIVQTSIHPSWWACPLCEQPFLSQGGAADIAVIEIAEDTPQIPEAKVELDPIAVGTQVVKVGWGCEESINVDPSTLELGRYKAEDAWILPTSDIRHHDSPITDEQIATIDASYWITAGHDQNENFASLCLGDSGGPLYLPDDSDPRIVGVNAWYTFRVVTDGVSWTDWHTKTALDSLHGVGQWLIELGVNTSGGEDTPSECTCPSGCDAIQPASVPFMFQGVVDTCYFFEDLGYSVNSHSMVQVNLNGQNITNTWIGNWSYPAERDGGYYLYLKGQVPWSWAQATD
ncbi:MAG TPA: trypsin-like serine protease [Polyangiaceae bacterium]|nr:trypsin-like serine protease [Polyangiaceae bacterium]